MLMRIMGMQPALAQDDHRAIARPAMFSMGMHFLRQAAAAAAAAALLSRALAAEPGARQFEALARLPGAGLKAMAGQEIEVDVDLAASSGLTVEVIGERAEVRYRMAFNQVAEGWSWRPLADPAVDDYYRYKFLPLQSALVEKGEYSHEDKIGVTQQVKVTWRYDYFLAFENLHDFYPRVADDDAGFSAELPADAAAHLGMRARARLTEPVISESTTFWKATYGNPSDFTLKKRYLIAILEEVQFVDTKGDRIHCRIARGAARCSAR
jgi:hypothetical protein